MVVSQWGLSRKNNQGKTGPGHSMVVSQWSSPERKVHLSPWLAAAPTQIDVRAQAQSQQTAKAEATHASPKARRGFGDRNLAGKGPSRVQANKIRRQGDVRAHITLAACKSAKISVVYTAFVQAMPSGSIQAGEDPACPATSQAQTTMTLLKAKLFHRYSISPGQGSRCLFST